MRRSGNGHEDPALNSNRCSRRQWHEQLGGLTPQELAVVAASLADIADRLEAIKARLERLRAAAQVSVPSTSRSTFDSRSSMRPRSS